MSIPSDLLYSDTHEWIRVEGKEAVFGITDFAQHALGDITYIDLPVVGTVLATGAEMGVVESVKAASDLFAPINCTVTAVNEALNEHPELVNQSPYGDGWMVRVTLSSDTTGLMSAADYDKFAKE